MNTKTLLDLLRPDKDQSQEKLTRTCKKCGGSYTYAELADNTLICPGCGTYFRMNAWERLAITVDTDSFTELDKSLQSTDPLSFPGYDAKLTEAARTSNLTEAVVCGTARIGSYPCGIFVMDSHFMMGSMGSVVGEKITRLFEHCTKHRLPVVGFVTSGGARMQEGIISLMQMAKVSGAVRKHSDSGGLYLSVLTDPTTGGVTASFAMQGDIILAEPKALIGFAGARVIEQTTGEKLPEGFQRAEFLLEHGFLDGIEERKRMKYTLTKLLQLHSGKEVAG